jgi:hypothetical protein
MSVQRAVFDDGTGPHASHQIILGYELTMCLDENGKKFEGSAADRH